jgi:hypothetical protein
MYIKTQLAWKDFVIHCAAWTLAGVDISHAFSISLNDRHVSLLSSHSDVLAASGVCTVY